MTGCGKHTLERNAASRMERGYVESNALLPNGNVHTQDTGRVLE